MRNLKTIKPILAALILALTLSLPAAAQKFQSSGRGNSDEPRMRIGMGMMGDGIAPEAPMRREIPDLTDDQKSKIDDIHVKYQKQIQPLQNQIGEKEAHLKTLMSEEKVNKSEVYSTIDEIGVLQTKIRKLHTDAHLEVKQILTDKQKTFFDDFGGGFGRGMGRRM